jgi:hypothetical protein
VAQQRPALRHRLVVPLLLGLGVFFGTAAASLAVGRDWFSTFGISALIGPLLLFGSVFLVRGRSSIVLLIVASSLLAAVSGLALLFAVIAPFAAVGPLIALSFSWVVGIAVIVCIALIERPSHA